MWKRVSAPALWAVAAAVFLAAPVAVPVRAAAQDAPAAAQQEQLVIDSQGQRYVLRIDLARRDEELARGLMFRRQIADDYGMLFDFGADRQVSMWMHNTYVSLDMLFIDRHGVIRKIHERAKPLDDTIIRSGEPVRAVLEIKGGGVAARGLKVGDRVEHPMFEPLSPDPSAPVAPQ